MKKEIIGLITCILLNIGNTTLAIDKPPTVEVNPPKLVSSNTYEDVVSIKNIKYSNEYIDINIKLPKINVGNKITKKIMNDTIEKDILKLKDDIEKEARESYKTYKNKEEYRRYSFDSDFKVMYDKNNILSIVNTIYFYTGGAHGITIQQAYNFDTNTGKLAYLKDFFYEDENYRNVILNKVKKEINSNKELYYSGIENSINGIPIDQKFYLTENDIVVFYDVYDIAPYVAGIREFKIPYSKFNKGVKDKINVKVDNIMIKNNRYVKENEKISEYLYYPEIRNLTNPVVEKKVNTIIQNDIENLRKQSKKLSNDGKKIGLSVYNIDYFLNDNIISLDITYSANDGTMINSILYDKGYNFNVINGKFYELKEVFKEDFDYVEKINSIINSQIKTINETSSYKYKYKFNGIKENQEYFIYRGNLVIMFNAGEILNKDFGNIKFYIPMNKFDDNVNKLFGE